MEGTRLTGRAAGGRVESRHGGGGRPTEGGEDRDTKGFDVQPFHRLYFSGSLLSLRLVSSLSLTVLRRTPLPRGAQGARQKQPSTNAR